MKKTYLITNVVYGDLYLKIFLERHLRSLLDVTNLEEASKSHAITYKIYCDEETKAKLEAHPTIKRLASVIERVDLEVFKWHETTQDRFGARYGLLMQAFHESVRYAVKENFDYLTAWVADLVVAREFFPRILSKMDQGHDAVFVLPLRSAFESTSQIFSQLNRALIDTDLFYVGFTHLHPLWIACHWDNPSFTRMPYTLLWKSDKGLLARSYSITPIVFKPSEHLTESGGMIDGDIPRLFTNPHWCEDWTDAPVIGVEPLFCHYPPFYAVRSSVKAVRMWAYRPNNPPIHASQTAWLFKHLYYPSKALAKIPALTKMASDITIRRIARGKTYKNPSL